MYKLGTVVKDKKVVDIKRIWHVSLIHVMRQMEEYRNQGYELDLSSVRDLGIQKQLNMVKFENIVQDEIPPILPPDTPPTPPELLGEGDNTPETNSESESGESETNLNKEQEQGDTIVSTDVSENIVQENNLNDTSSNDEPVQELTPDVITNGVTDVVSKTTTKPKNSKKQ